MGATLSQTVGGNTEKVRGEGPNVNGDSPKCFQDQEGSVFLNGLGVPGHAMLTLAHCCYVSETI